MLEDTYDNTNHFECEARPFTATFHSSRKRLASHTMLFVVIVLQFRLHVSPDVYTASQHSKV